jgi:methylase of polypeptide subunit release factors
MEIGYNEAASIKKIFSGKWAREEFIKDYQGIERIAVIKQLNHG